MDLVALHKKAGEETGKFIAGVGDDQWDKLSNCGEWTVRDLVNHIVSENFWVKDLIEGKTVEEVGDKYDGDMMGNDPLASYGKSINLANEAISSQGAMEKIVHLSYGDFKAGVYIGHRLNDLVIHGWDVAKSSGQKDDLDLELLKALWEIMEPQIDGIQGSEMFGTPINLPDEAPLQDKILGALGRKR